jgi:hypothetical protein
MRIETVSAALACVLLAGLPQLGIADVVTGKLTPADAKAVIIDAAGKTVAELKPGAYQLQLPPGRYKAQCQAPGKREQEFLSLSEPVTVNLDCS